jgi:hypothetical protein
MTKFCESCHTPNINRAKYCRGCAGRFSGILTPASTFSSTMPDGRSERPLPRAEAMRVDDILAVRRSTMAREQPTRRFPGFDAPVVLSLIVVVSLSAAFVAWYWNRAPVRSYPSTPMATAQAEPVVSRQEPVAPAPPPVAKELEPEPEPLRKQEARTGTLDESPPPIAAPPEPKAASVVAPQESASIEASQAAAPRQQDEAASSPPRKVKVARATTRRGAPTHPVPTAIAVAEVRPVEGLQVENVPAPRAHYQAGAGPAVGSMTRCDRLNPFGEALCMDPR